MNNPFADPDIRHISGNRMRRAPRAAAVTADRTEILEMRQPFPLKMELQKSMQLLSVRSKKFCREKSPVWMAELSAFFPRGAVASENCSIVSRHRFRFIPGCKAHHEPDWVFGKSPPGEIFRQHLGRSDFRGMKVRMDPSHRIIPVFMLISDILIIWGKRGIDKWPE